jgi:hypothetical protein
MYIKKGTKIDKRIINFFLIFNNITGFALNSSSNVFNDYRLHESEK